jgi:hypothetical protein
MMNSIRDKTGMPHRGQAMRLPRIQFTVRRVMIAIAIVSLFLAVFMHRERIRRVNQMVINQEITKDSAEANFMNAGLDREAAEQALGQYIENHDGLQAKVSLSETSQARLSAELTGAEDLVATTIRQLDDGTDTDARLARQTTLTVLRHYIKTVNSHVAATEASRLAAAQGPRETARVTLQGKVEEARSQERVKKMIWEYEKALLNSLKRERTNRWW